MKHRNIIIASSLFLLSWWVAWPAFTYKHGTAVNMSTELVASPFIDANELIYRWSGDVVRSCPVEIRRRITDSEGVVTNLVSTNFGPIPSYGLGLQSYEISITVPKRISEGPAVYEAVEVPRCSWMQRLLPVSVPYPIVEFTVTRPNPKT